MAVKRHKMRYSLNRRKLNIAVQMEITMKNYVPLDYPVTCIGKLHLLDLKWGLTINRIIQEK